MKRTGLNSQGWFKAGAVVIFVFLFILGLGSATRAAEPPIKIGVLLPVSGPLGITGQNVLYGMEVYLEKIGYRAGGRQLVLIKEDEGESTQAALTKARKLVERDKVDILTGVFASPVAYAVRDYVHDNKIPLIISNAGAEGLTREKGSKYIFRVSFVNGQYPKWIAPWALKNGYKRMAVMCSNFAAGHEKAADFKKLFTSGGGAVTEELFPKLGQEDFGPYLTKLGKADAVFAFFAGSDSIRFVKQYDEYGLKKRMQLTGDGSLVDEMFLESLGDSALGLVTAHHYSPNYDAPENREFVEAYRKKTKLTPSFFAKQGYLAAGVIAHALDALKGNTQNTEQVLNAIRNVKFIGPGGPFRFKPETQNIIFNVFITRTERVEGKLVNKVIEIIRDVEDPWPSK